MIADSLDRPLRFIPTGGQVGDVVAAPALLDGFQAEAVLAEQGLRFQRI